MSDYQLLAYPHKHLRTKTLAITQFDVALQESVSGLLSAMKDMGTMLLSSVQVGLSQRLFVMDTSEAQNKPQVFINPEIVQTEGVVQSEEDCLSFPGATTTLKRAKSVTVRYQDVNGVEQNLTADAMESVLIQHAVDSLNGVLLIDHLSTLKREMFLKKYKKGMSRHIGECHDESCTIEH